MYNKNTRRYFFFLIMLVMVFSLVSMNAWAAEVEFEPIAGVGVTTSNATSKSMSSNGEVTVTAKGSAGGWFGIGASATTTTITITNTSSSTANISFDWTATSVNSLTIDGATASGSSGSKSKGLGSGASFTVVVTTAKNNTENKLVLSNFTIEAAAATSNVTFQYNALGSITVDGNAITSGSNLDVASSGVELVANPISGATFLGWVNGTTHERLSTSTTYTLQAVGNMTVIAAFASADSNAWFLVDNAYLSDELSTAATLGKKLVLAHDGTLPTGNYTIPSGVTLLIPFNNANDCYTTTPGTMTYDRDAGETFNTYKPYVYRTLTMANGANITVHGAISVSGKHSATQGSNGSPIDAYGLINMNSGSSITVENGGVLYAWGYITGSGSVAAKSGASVYENFQLTDWRGGNASSAVMEGEETYSVFPFSQYYIQNIEVPLTVYAGAYEYTRMSVDVTLAGVNGTTVPFIGTSGSMFALTNGYIVKDYMEGTGRIKVDVHGDISFSPISISIKNSVIGSLNINSANYVLPISGHMTVDMKSGTVSVAQDMALLPGCELYLREGAKFNLGTGKSLYVYDLGEWGGYCYTNNAKYVKLNYVPGGNGTTGREKDAFVQVDGSADLSAGYTYTTTSGANICSTGTGVIKMAKGSETVTYQVTQSGNKVSVWNEIPITAAKLKNADGSYLQSDTNTYAYTNGKWICEKHTDADADNVCDVCGVTICDHANTELKNVKEATCTEDGYSGDKVCTACGTTVETGTVITAAGSHSGGTATCTEKATCGVCGQEYGELADHAYADPVVNFSDDGTTYTVTVTCSVCAEGITDHAKTSDPLKSKVKENTPGDCKTNSTTTYEASGEFEGVTYSDTKIIEGALGAHTPGAEATCTTAQTCTVCGAELVAATGHSYESVVTAPTCTAGGYTTHTCTACGDSYVTDEVETVGHSYKEEITTTATCEADGVKTLTCTTCGDSYTETITKLGHNMQQTAAEVAPTCEMPGKTAIQTCANNCGKTEGGEDIPAIGHKDENKDHACDNGCDAYQGTHADSAMDNDHVCDYCGKEIENGETCSDVTTDKDHKCDVCGKENVTKHEYTSEVTAPTCTTGGYTTHTCNCGHSYTDSEVAAGHTIEQVAAQAKTCTQEGWDAYEYCTKCDYTTKAVIPAGHTLTQVEAKAATCTEIGWEAYEKCSQCDYTTYKEIPDTGHKNTETINASTATCGKAGYTGDTYCNDCETTIANGKVIPATGEHTYDNACDAECNVCSAIRTPADHVYDNACDTNCNVCGAERSITHAWKDATCTDPKTCTVCGATEGEATGHVNTTSSTVQNDDGSTHTTTVTCACGEVVSIATGTCTDAGSGSCECGRVMQAKVNVDNKTKTEDIWTVTGTTMNVKHDLACVVLVEETDGTYSRLNATAKADGSYDFDVSGVGNKKVVIAVKGDTSGDGNADISDALQIVYSGISNTKPAYQALNSYQACVGELSGDRSVDITDALQIVYSGISTTKPAYAPIEWDVLP